MRAKIKPVQDEYAAQIGEQLMKNSMPSSEKARKRT